MHTNKRLFTDEDIKTLKRLLKLDDLVERVKDLESENELLRESIRDLENRAVL